MSLAREKKNVLVLFVAQALFITIWALMTISGGLTGAALAPNKALATLPFTAMIIANAVTTLPASLLMRRVGRRAGFIVATLTCAAGGLLAAWAVHAGDFWLFNAGAFVMGVFAGFAQFYRFAAADVASPQFKARAISLVVAGGVAAAVLAPEITKGATALSPVPFFGVYLAMAALAVASVPVLAFLDIPRPLASSRERAGRPLVHVMRQPIFVVAALGGMVSYGVMLLVMTATPLAIVARGYGVHDAAFAIQGHIIGMFAPALVTGTLIRRFGVLNVMLAGLALMLACSLIALAGVALAHFWLALAALGLGWNFAFIGASTLLTESYTAEEREKVQGINDLVVFTTVAVASLSSGAILHLFSWQAVQWAVMPSVALAAAATLWLLLKRRAGLYPAIAGGG